MGRMIHAGTVPAVAPGTSSGLLPPSQWPLPWEEGAVDRAPTPAEDGLPAELPRPVIGKLGRRAVAAEDGAKPA